MSFILSQKNGLKWSYGDGFFGFGKNCLVSFIFKSKNGLKSYYRDGFLGVRLFSNKSAPDESIYHYSGFRHQRKEWRLVVSF